MAEREPDPFKLYTVMRRSLKIHGGKIGSQCQHAYDYLTRQLEILEHGVRQPSEEELDQLTKFRAWRSSPEHVKIVLGASDDEFEEVKKAFPNDYYVKRHFLVIDLGFTQVAPNTETCLCVWPMRVSLRPPILQKLRPL